jgi:putative membrane protein
MSRTVSSLLGAILFLWAICSAAAGAESLTDAQAAHFLLTAEQSDIDAANLALRQTSNSLIKAFANETSQKHMAVKQRISASLNALNVMPVDNDYSKSLAGSAAQHQQDLAKLSGPAFDKAYANNELSYDVLVIGVLKGRLIASAKSNEIRSLLEAGLAAFQDQLKSARSLTLTFN